jgi:hypothetical protein
LNRLFGTSKAHTPISSIADLHWFWLPNS